MKLFIPICAILVWATPLISTAQTDDKESLLEASIKEVSVFVPKQEAKNKTLELSGTIIAKQDAQLGPLEPGLVESIFVEAGDTVKVGQLLLSLDNTLAKLRLAQAQANLKSSEVQLAEAKRQLAEVISLAKRKVVADSLLAERRAGVSTAQASLASANAQVSLQKEMLKRHQLLAPFDGVIAKRNVDVGEWISQQNQIFQLVSHESLRMVADLPQEHLHAVKNAKDIKAIVSPDALESVQLELKLTSVVAVSSAISRTVQVRIDLPKTDGVIPGMSARAKIQLSSQETELSWLPSSALKRHPDGGQSAFIVQGNRVKRVQVKVIKSTSDKVAVSGIPLGSRVVANGTELLKDNQLVKVSLSKGGY